MGLTANIARLTDRTVGPFITSKQLLDARLQLVEPSLAAFATSRLLLNGLHLIEDGLEVRLLAITQDLRQLDFGSHVGQQGAELLVLLGIALVGLGQLFSFCHRGFSP